MLFKQGNLAMRLLAVGIGVVSIAAWLHAVEGTPEERFSKARTRAKANLEEPVGQEYDRLLHAHFERHNASVLQQCFQTTKDPEVKPFEMVFRLSKRGEALDVLVWPETNIGGCFRNGLKEQSFPIPPEEEYWAYMEMRFAP